jgi:polyisoprenyl-phosphate glycosyltransferase
MLSLIIPVFKNQQTLEELLQAVDRIGKDVVGGFEAVFVVDGSPDRCYEILLRQLPECAFSSQLVLLSRNFGSFAAVRAGLQAGRGDHFAVMAADLQEPPALVLDMHKILIAGGADVVVGVRKSRNDPRATRLTSAVFWWLYRRYVIPEMPVGGIDIFGCNEVFRDELLKLEERHSSLVAQVFWMGYRRSMVTYERIPRADGSSGWTFAKKLKYMMDSVFAFTDLPIRILIRTGALVSIISGAFALTVIASRLAGWITVPGYAMTMVALIFFGALNLFALGIVGSYAWRAYENTKARPHHLVLREHHWRRDPVTTQVQADERQATTEPV